MWQRPGTEDDIVSAHRGLDASEVYRLPRPPLPGPTADAFVLFPFALLQALTPEQHFALQLIYRLALERAQIENTPSLLERDLLAVWN